LVFVPSQEQSSQARGHLRTQTHPKHHINTGGSKLTVPNATFGAHLNGTPRLPYPSREPS
ncbi:hypothetical protein, partial [Amycolatopsis speibonae]